MFKYGQQVFSLKNAPSDAIYIGRGKNFVFGNPFPMTGEEDRARVCIEYRKWLGDKVKHDKDFAEKVKSLHGKNVKCFCSNGTQTQDQGARWCHGHILLSCAEYLTHQY